VSTFKTAKLLFLVKTTSDKAKHFTDLLRQLIANNIIGVSEGLYKGPRNRWCWLPCSCAREHLLWTWLLDFSHPVVFEAPAGISASSLRLKLESKSAESTSNSSVKSLQTFARSVKPEPYKGKGIRYEGEHVRRKAGKSAK
jgi:large subunit ribosomal protein L6